VRIVYAGQFRDLSGYGIAARLYLEALDSYLEENPGKFELKIYSVITSKDVRGDIDFSLVEKYEFKDNAEIEEWLGSKYTCLWHMPPPMILFSDFRFSCNDNCTPSLKRLIECAESNINFVAWETDKVPNEWARTYEYCSPDLIITPCEWNSTVFERDSGIKSVTVPHVIKDSGEEQGFSVDSFEQLDDQFVVFTMSQWTKRKGFDILIKAFCAEFADTDDVKLIIKTYEGPASNLETIKNEIRSYKNSFLLANGTRPEKNNIMLLPEYIPESKINWLRSRSDVFALTTRGEGFGLPIAESVTAGIPVIVPREGGHIDYLDEESTYFVDGSWDNCFFIIPPYDCDMNWYESSLKSTREQLRLAYQDWKSGSIRDKGLRAKQYIDSKGWNKLNIGKRLYEELEKTRKSSFYESQKEKDWATNDVAHRRRSVKRKLLATSSMEKKLATLKDSFEGETCYILNCGPSLKSFTPDEYRHKLKNKLVFAVKQAYEYVPDIVDFHLFNCANLPLAVAHPLPEHYQYKGYVEDQPVVVASSNYDLGQRWYETQRSDVFFKIPIRTEINNEFLCLTRNFGEHTIEKTLTRPCGPGIMYETVIYMALHLGVKKIIATGWDLSGTNPKNDKEYDHFYGQQKMFNKGDILPWEVKATCEASEQLFYWLRERGVELELASDQSALFDGIPRVKL